METKQSESLLFVTRGNQLQLFDYETEKIIKKYEFESDIEALDLKSDYSPHRTYYYCYNKKRLLVCRVDGLYFYEPIEFNNLETAYFIGDNDKYIVMVTKGENEYESLIYTIDNKGFVLLTTFTTNFIKAGSRFVEVNNNKDEFFVHYKLNCIVRYRLENKKHVEIKKIIQNTQIHNYHVTDKLILTISNNINIENKNFTSTTVYDLDGNLLHNRDFRNVQEAKIIHNDSSKVIRLSFNGFCSSIYGQIGKFILRSRKIIYV